MTKETTTEQCSNLPAVAQKWALVGQSMDQIAGEVSLSKTSSMSNFSRAMATAVAVQELRKMLTEPNMQPILALQGTTLGFRTDRDKEGGYPLAIVRDCVIDASLRGASLVGNEMNIISERPYYTREYYTRVCGSLPGMESLHPSFGVPTINGPKATVEVDCTWKLHGVAMRLTPGPGREKGRILVVKVNSGQGDDQVLGKATRKLFKAVYEQITGSPSGDDGDVDEIGGVIEASAKVVPEAPPVGRIASQPSNGGQPRGPECKAEWDTLHKFSDAYGDEIINEARYDAGYSEVAIAACNARQLSAIINKLVEWETNRKLSKQEKEPAVAGKSGGKKDMF